MHTIKNGSFFLPHGVVYWKQAVLKMNKVYCPHVSDTISPMPVSATAGGCMATLTSGFDFQRGISYQCFIVTIALKCTVSELGMRQTVRQTHGRIAALLKRNAPLWAQYDENL